MSTRLAALALLAAASQGGADGAHRIAGYVSDANGRVIRDARVAILPESKDGEAKPEERVVYTDPKGWFEAEVPVTVACDVHAFHADVGETRSRVPKADAASATTFLQLDLEPFDIDATSITGHGSIQGRLLLNGEPTTGLVWWRGRRGARGSGKVRVVDAAAGFVLPDVSPGEVVLGGTPDIGQAYLHEDRRYSTVALVGRTQHVTHDIDLEIALDVLEGRVVLPPTVGVDDFELVAWGRMFRRKIPCEPGGHFEALVPDDGTYHLQVRTGTVEVERDRVPAGTRGIVLRVSDVGRLLYRFVDVETDRRLPHATLLWRRKGEAEWKEALSPRREPPDEDAPPHVTFVPLGSLELLAFDTEHGYRPCRDLRVDVAPGPDATPLTIGMVPGFTLRLRLAEGQGRLPRADISLVEESAWEDPEAAYPRDTLDARRTLFGLEDELELRGLAPGVYRFHFGREGFAIRPERIAVPTQRGAPVLIEWSVTK